MQALEPKSNLPRPIFSPLGSVLNLKQNSGSLLCARKILYGNRYGFIGNRRQSKGKEIFVVRTSK